MPDHLDEELSQQPAELQEEAGTVTADLCLVQVLSAVGKPMPVGSALWASWCGGTSTSASCAASWRPRPSHDSVPAWRFIRECEKCCSATTQGVGTSIPSPRTAAISACIIEPAPGTTGRSTWFADEPDRQRDLAHARSLPPRLTPTTRAAILPIKDTWCKRPEYGKAVRSYDIYPAVLDGYPRTLEQFAQWLQRRTG